MDSREKDNALEGMLRRTLASQPRSSGTAADDQCPSAEILAAYYERSLSADESAACEMHFSQCLRCREALAVMVRAEEITEPASKWAWFLSPYWLAPAIAGLALVIFLAVRHPSQTAVNVAPVQQPASVAIPQRNEPAAPATSQPAPNTDAAPQADKRLALSPAERDALETTERAKVQAPASALSDKETTPAPVSNSIPNNRVQDLPLNGRNFIQLDKLKTQNAPQTQAKDEAATQQSLDDAKKSTDAVAITAESAPAAGALPEVPKPQSPGAAQPRNGRDFSPSIGGVVRQNQAQAPPEMRRYEAATPAAGARVPDASASVVPQQKIFKTPNSNVLWRSEDGFVERSIDGGANWFGQQLPGTSGEIDAGSSPNPKVCWLVGTSGTIYVTKDAANWRKIPPPVAGDFTAVEAKDGNTAVVTATDGRRFQTTNAGMTWKSLN